MNSSFVFQPLLGFNLNFRNFSTIKVRRNVMSQDATTNFRQDIPVL